MLRTTYYTSHNATRGNKAKKSDQPRGSTSWQTAVLLALYVAGIVVGSYYVKTGATGPSYPLFRLMTQSLEIKGSEGLIATFLGSLFSVMVYAAGAYVLGFCALGAPFIALLPAMRGLGLGISLAYLYAAYGWQGFTFSLVMVVPFSVVSSLAMIVACRQSLRLSLLLFINLFDNAGKIKTVASEITVRYIYIIAVIFAAALVDSVVATLLSGIVAVS